jgi:hypothetical protein
MQHPSSTDPDRGNAVRDGMAARSEAGFLVRKARLGYQGVHTPDGTVERPDPRLAASVRSAFEMAAHGKSLRAITARLRSQGVEGARGGPIAVSTVQRMLSDPFYAGLIEDETGRLVWGNQELIVSEQLFRAAQRRLAARRYGPLR